MEGEHQADPETPPHHSAAMTNPSILRRPPWSHTYDGRCLPSGAHLQHRYPDGILLGGSKQDSDKKALNSLPNPVKSHAAPPSGST